MRHLSTLFPNKKRSLTPAQPILFELGSHLSLNITILPSSAQLNQASTQNPEKVLRRQVQCNYWPNFKGRFVVPFLTDDESPGGFQATNYTLPETLWLALVA